MEYSLLVPELTDVVFAGRALGWFTRGLASSLGVGICDLIVRWACFPIAKTVVVPVSFQRHIHAG